MSLSSAYARKRARVIEMINQIRTRTRGDTAEKCLLEREERFEINLEGEGFQSTCMYDLICECVFRFDSEKFKIRETHVLVSEII